MKNIEIQDNGSSREFEDDMPLSIMIWTTSQKIRIYSWSDDHTTAQARNF
jgi:hypothetical protein